VEQVPIFVLEISDFGSCLEHNRILKTCIDNSEVKDLILLVIVSDVIT